VTSSSVDFDIAFEDNVSPNSSREKMSKIELKPCLKAYILETHRHRPPDSTLHFVEGMKELLGMKDFQEATHIDRTGIPVFTCYRVRPDNSKTFHTGKGASKIQAQVSLTAESIERYSSEYRDEYREKLLHGSFSALRNKFNVLDPGDLVLSSYSEYTPDSLIHWIRGYDIARNEEILVPACEVFHPYHLDEISVLHTNTNGLAAGNTLEEAVFHAMTEVIERDAWSIAKYNHLDGDALYIEDAPENRFLLDIVEKFEQAEIHVVARDITSDIGVPVIAAFSKDLLHEDMVAIDGFGSHLDPKVAMARSLMELAATRALFIMQHGLEGLRETSLAYLDGHQEMEDFRFYASREKGLAEMEVGYSQDILEDIHTVLGRLRARGLDRTIVVDLSRKETGIPTVKVIIPGTETHCFDRGRRGDRLLRHDEKGG
jgi:putative methanogenesis marker protein 1